jgi:RHS repeat-associated protein
METSEKGQCPKRQRSGNPCVARVALGTVVLGASLLIGAHAASPTAGATLEGPTTSILDDFDGRGLEDPLFQWGNWSTASIDGSGQTLEILGGTAGHNEGESTDADSYRSADATGDVEAYATIAATPDNNQDMYIYINLQQTGTPGWDGYRARWFHWISVDGLYLEKVMDGVATRMVPPVQLDPAVSDTILIRNNAGRIELWHKSGGTWILRLSAVDGSFQGGKIGLGSNDEKGRWDEFGGTGSTTPPPTPPSVPTTGVLDGFERANEDPLSQGGSWSPTPISGAGETLEVLALAAGQNEGETVQANSFRSPEITGDAEVHARIAATPDNNQWFYLYLHVQQPGTAGWDGYRAAWFHWISTDGLYIQRVDNGVATTIAGPLALDPAVGDSLLMRRFGTALELWRKNSATWTKLLSTLDTSYTSGKLGLGLDDEKGKWDDFGGGSIGTPPPPPPPSYEPLPEQSIGICSGAGVHARAGSRCLSDPVNTLTGAFIIQTEDIATAGTGVSFSWNRSYTSSDPTVGRLGPGWTDSYSTSLVVHPTGDVTLHGDEGQRVEYARHADGSFVGAPGSLSTLAAVAGGYELVRTDQVVYRFDDQGRVVSQRDRNGQGLAFAYDGQGRLTRITDAANRATTISHDASGFVSQVSTFDGRRVAYGYTDGQLTSVTDVLGKTWTYTYDSGGRLATIVDPLQHTQVTNVYSGDGRVRSQTDSVGKTTSFAWDPDTEVASVTDANGKVWKHDYDGGVLAKQIDPLTRVTVFAHDSDVNATGVTSPTGETTTMAYDAAGNMLSATAPASLGSAQKTFAYNDRNDPVRITDARGTVTSHTYDASGNTTGVTQGGTQVASYTYDAAGRVLTSADGNGKTTKYAHDTSGNLSSVTDPLGNATSYTYDSAGRVISRIDPKGNLPGATPADFTSTWTYNPAGQVLKERDPLGNVTTHAYDDAGNELAITDAKGRTTSYAFDDANRVLSETRPDPDGGGPLEAPVTKYTYDDVGNKLSATDPLGRTTTFAYDSANRLVSTTGPDPDGAGSLVAPTTSRTHDPNGNLASIVEPRGNVQGGDPDDFRTRYSYDAAGRLLTTTDPLGHVTANTYDQVGNLVSVRDANNHTTAYGYDAAARLLSVTAPDGGSTNYTYDDAGNRLTRRDDSSHLTTYAYDGAGRLVSEVGPDPDGAGPKSSAVTSHSYDANGNPVTTVDPNGNATSIPDDGKTGFGYDRANRLLSIDYSDSTPDVAFAYDPVGNRLQMTDGAGTEVRAFDGLDRLLSVTRGSTSFSFAYDAVGNIARRIYPGARITEYEYDGLDRLSIVRSNSQAVGYSYDIASNLVQTTLPADNGHLEARQYDRAGRLTEVASRKGAITLVSFTATLDPVGNPTQVMRTGTLDQTQSYAYDASDRIVSVCFQVGTCPGASDPFIRWTHDKVGNRLTEQRPSGTTSYSYDSADRLLAAGSTSYTYDQNGNEVSAGGRTSTYDLANRMKSTKLGSTTTVYSYDGDGGRLQASTGSKSSQKTNFLWDVAHALPQIAIEQNGSGLGLRSYTYGARRLSMTSGSATSYYHYDSLGSVANVTSSSGSQRWTYAYEPFGTILTEERSGGNAPTNVMKFTGEYLDATGLYHLRARQYDPASGRFLSPDPLSPAADQPQVSTFAYVQNRPTVLRDPSGAIIEPVDGGPFYAGEATSVAWFPIRPIIDFARLPCAARRGHPLGRVGGFLGGPYAGTHTRGNWQSDRAVDISVPIGTWVCAVFGGRIADRLGPLNSSEPALAGLRLTIMGQADHAYYAHLSRIVVKRKQQVIRGQFIGLSGSANGSPHLHIALREGDPTRFCKPARILSPCF